MGLTGEDADAQGQAYVLVLSSDGNAGQVIAGLLRSVGIAAAYHTDEALPTLALPADERQLVVLLMRLRDQGERDLLDWVTALELKRPSVAIIEVVWQMPEQPAPHRSYQLWPCDLEQLAAAVRAAGAQA